MPEPGIYINEFLLDQYHWLYNTDISMMQRLLFLAISHFVGWFLPILQGYTKSQRVCNVDLYLYPNPYRTF